MMVLTDLTHCGLETPYGASILVNIASGNCLLPDGTKPLPEPMLTSKVPWHSHESNLDNSTLGQESLGRREFRDLFPISWLAPGSLTNRHVKFRVS